MKWLKKLRVKVIELLAGDDLQIVLNVTFEDGLLYLKQMESGAVKGCTFNRAGVRHFETAWQFGGVARHEEDRRVCDGNGSAETCW